MIHEYDIRQKMDQATRREISVPAFIHWVMSNSWNMHRDSSKSAIDLASEIHLLMAERDDFLLDDAAFLRELAILNNAHDVSVINVEYIEAWPLNQPRAFTSTTPVLVAAAHL